MFKYVRLVKRRSDLTLAQFKSRWLEAHAGVERRALEISPMRKMVVSFSTGEVALGGNEAPFDAMVAAYFGSLDELRATVSGPVAEMIREDARELIDPSQAPIHIAGEEQLMAERGGAERALKQAGQLKVVRTVYRRRDLNNEQFKAYWLQNHSRLKGNAIGSPGVQRIVATFAIPQDGRDPDFDGMVELYFDTVEDIRRMFAGAVPNIMRRDEENFVQMEAPAVRVITEEYLIGEKPRA